MCMEKCQGIVTGILVDWGIKADAEDVIHSSVVKMMLNSLILFILFLTQLKINETGC